MMVKLQELQVLWSLLTVSLSVCLEGSKQQGSEKEASLKNMLKKQKTGFSLGV